MSDEVVSEGLWPAADTKMNSLTRASLLLEACALSLGFDTVRINRRGFLAGANGEFSAFGFQESISTETSRAAVRICEDRVARKEALRRDGVKIPRSRSFAADEVHEAEKYAAGLGATYVKPRSAEHRVARKPLQSGEEAAASMQQWVDELGRHQTYLVERRVGGREYSFYVVGGEVVSVVLRRSGNWAKEVYRPGSAGFGNVHPEILQLAVRAAAAMPTMPHCTVQIVVRNIEATPDRSVVVAVSPQILLMGTRPDPEWSVFLADSMVRYAARGRAGNAGDSAAREMHFEFDDVADSDSVATAVQAWLQEAGITGEARTLGRAVTGFVIATPGQAVGMSGMAKAGRFGGGVPQTVTLSHKA